MCIRDSSMSHEATFSILKGIREQILNKLPKLPLGTVMDMSSGQMKQIIVDQVESMERPLAHLLPEMTANLPVSYTHLTISSPVSEKAKPWDSGI